MIRIRGLQIVPEDQNTEERAVFREIAAGQEKLPGTVENGLVLRKTFHIIIWKHPAGQAFRRIFPGFGKPFCDGFQKLPIGVGEPAVNAKERTLVF